MKKLLLVALFVLAGAASAASVEDVIKLQQSGVDEKVILAFVEKSNFSIRASDLQTLRDAGVSDDVMIAMMKSSKVDLPVAEDKVVAPPEGQVTVSTFYEALTPHGVWVQDADLGWVWQPKVVVSVEGWAPYCHEGHWVWTNCGWYWESSYEWGWAAFHYGRWCRHKTLTWVWVPDCTWGPAWVSWRECDTHYGWAPLPPHCEFNAGVGFSFHGKHCDFGFEFGLGVDDYCFVPCGSFLEINIGHHRCHRDVCAKVYNKTVIHNTYVYNKTVINEGCKRDVVETRTHTKIEEVRVHSAKISAGAQIRGERRTTTGIVAYRPEVRKETPRQPNEIQQKREEARQVREQRQQKQQEHHEAIQKQQQEHHEAVQQKQHEAQQQHQAPPHPESKLRHPQQPQQHKK